MNPAVDLYIESQPAEVQSLLHAARQRLLALDPRIREEFKYGVPFYRYHTLFAYLTSVPRQLYVHLGLTRGIDLADAGGRLVGHERKSARHIRVRAVAELDEDSVLELLHAALLNEDQRKAAGKKRRQA